MNITPHQIVLQDLKQLLLKLDVDSFCYKNKTLFDVSIGEHFRHIIEFYLCCFSQKETEIVNYDLRKRDKQLEVDIHKGVDTIDMLLAKLNKLGQFENTPLTLNNSLEVDTVVNKDVIKTSFFRELIYCMDHCIHHQSLIKIALLEQNLLDVINPNFGVAFSTQLFQNTCAS